MKCHKWSTVLKAGVNLKLLSFYKHEAHESDPVVMSRTEQTQDQ